MPHSSTSCIREPKGYDDDPFRGQVVIARLRQGVTLGGAQAAVDAMIRTFVAEHPSSYRTGSVRLSLSSVDEDVVSDVKPALVALAGAVGFVLLVACANLMNLMLARACGRSRELAVRTAIGASRVQILRQLATEGLVLGFIGAAAGLLVAQWGIDGLVRLAPATLPHREKIAIDFPVALFAAGMSTLCSLVFGLVPAWQATRGELASMMKPDPAGTRAAGTTRGLLVASQLALSLVLLVGAGLLMRAFVTLRAVPLGFEPRGAATLNVHVQNQRFDGGTIEEARAKRLAFYRALIANIRQIPGVEQAGFGLPAPLNGPDFISQRFSLDPTDRDRQAEGVIALGGYLEALRVPLVAGRYFATADDDRRVAIVDRRLAEEFWPSESAVGHRLFLRPTVGEATWVDIIGIVGHVQMRGVRSAGLPQIWLTYGSRWYNGLNVVVRGRNAAALLPAVERAVAAMKPGRPVHNVRTLDDSVANASADTRFALFVLGTFAALAVVLTAVGIYGVVVYTTARRTREIAVRLALGASGGRMIALVLRDGVWWIAAGLTAGMLAAGGLTRYLESVLFGVKPTDTITFVSVAALLGIVAAVASVMPALRAVRVDPMLALRSE